MFGHVRKFKVHGKTDGKPASFEQLTRLGFTRVKESTDGFMTGTHKEFRECDPWRDERFNLKGEDQDYEVFSPGME